MNGSMSQYEFMGLLAGFRCFNFAIRCSVPGRWVGWKKVGNISAMHYISFCAGVKEYRLTSDLTVCHWNPEF